MLANAWKFLAMTDYLVMLMLLDNIRKYISFNLLIYSFFFIFLMHMWFHFLFSIARGANMAIGTGRSVTVFVTLVPTLLITYFLCINSEYYEKKSVSALFFLRDYHMNSVEYEHEITKLFFLNFK